MIRSPLETKALQRETLRAALALLTQDLPMAMILVNHEIPDRLRLSFYESEEDFLTWMRYLDISDYEEETRGRSTSLRASGEHCGIEIDLACHITRRIDSVTRKVTL